MKVAAHPLVVAVAMGLLGPGALESEEFAEPSSPCIDCDEMDADEVALEASPMVTHAVREDARDPDVEGWLAHAAPTAEARAKALADYLATAAS